MLAEAMLSAPSTDSRMPGPPRWLALVVVWAIVTAIDYASRRNDSETCA